LLEATLAVLTVRGPEGPAEGEVAFARWVTVKDEDGRLATWRVVGPDEADARRGLLSAHAPLARALLGRRAGHMGRGDDPGHALRPGDTWAPRRPAPPPTQEPAMNDTFKEVKDRLRQLDAVLARGGNSNVDFAQAVSKVRRLVKKGDRSRNPSIEIRSGLDRAEAIGRAMLAS
jgi:hypothetical protein